MSTASAFRVPSALDKEVAVVIPAVAAALRVWDELGLELGEAAVVTAGHPLSRLVANVAVWYGALPVLVIGDEVAADPNVELVPVQDSDKAVSTLSQKLASRPGVVAAELSGRADFVDLLLETIPPLARVLFAGEQRERLTIDYYVNVHRKGLLLRSGEVSPSAERVTDPAAAARLDRAERLLQRADRALACRAALGLDLTPLEGAGRRIEGRSRMQSA